ncbi:MAG: hypothetical protein HY235_04880 [Acidobacteria bacterium]|nr:hypothetical protein [Acidobacteriota bacterium]
MKGPPSLLPWLMPLALWAQTPASVWIGAPENRIVAGSSVQLTAVPRDGSGRALSNVTCNWTAPPNAPFTVNSAGMTTAQALGIGDITAQCGNARNTIRLQAIPSSIVVTPSEKEISIGDTVAYSARVLDVNGRLIPDVPLTWNVIGEDGNNTASVFIGRDGTLGSVGVGRFTVRAMFNYNPPPGGQPGAGPGQFIPQFYGRARVTVRPPKSFLLTRLASTGDKRESFQLRPRRGAISANASGQVAFNASLEGYATGMFLLENGQPRLLAAAGEPGNVPGTMVYEFDEPALNNRGEVLATVYYWGIGSGLVWITPGSAPRFILQDGSALEDVRNIYSSRLALNDNGQGVFRATFLYPGTRNRLTGLFMISRRGDFELLVETSQRLAGMDAEWSLTSEFSIDNDGNVVFQVNQGQSSSVYRRGADGRVRRVLGTGDKLDGREVRSAWSPVHSLGGGHMAYIAEFTTGQRRLMLCPLADCSQAKYVENFQNNDLRSISAINESGQLVFYGNLGQAPGIYLWDGKAAPRAVFLEGRPSPSGSIFLSFQSAGVTANGDVIAQARLSSNLLSVVRGSGNQAGTLVQAGQMVTATAGAAFSALVLGDKVGPAHLLTGGWRTNVVEASPAGVFPRLLAGDRLPDGGWFEANTRPRKLPGGEMLIGTDESLHLMSAGGARLLRAFPVVVDGVPTYTPVFYTGNSSGVAAVLNNSAGVQRLFLIDAGVWRHAAWIGSWNPNYRTASPAGGNFDGINDMWVAEDGLLYGNMRINGGPGGLFSYNGQRWQSVALIDSEVDGRRLLAINDIRVGGARLFASFQLQNRSGIYELTPDGWRRLIASGDDSPTGNVINGVGLFDANRLGHVAVRIGSGGVPQLVLFTDSKLHVVLDYNQVTDAGEWLRDPVSIDLRDDGRVFFISRSYKDEFVLYEADPLF